MKKNFATQLIHAGEKIPESISRGKSVPIAMSSVFVFDDVESLDQVYEQQAHGYIYTRNGNPVHDALKEIMTTIEEGEAAEVYSSGMGAISVSVLSQLNAGDHIIAANVLYGGSFQLIKNELQRFNIEVTFVDPINEDIAPYFRENTRVVYIETISNPVMEVVNLPKIAEITHRHNAKLIVDNTFATPIICQPLKLGADIVVYSATKYLSGHSDVTAGVVVTDKVTIKDIYNTGLLFGPTMSPFDAWLIIRSLRTLELRIKKHSENALVLAQFLENHQKVKAVNYPGLKSSSTHRTGLKVLQNGLFGGMLSIDLYDGEKGAYDLIRNLETIKLVPSLAGVSTSTSYPAKTSHRSLSDEELERAGISKGLIRISTGLEHIDDILSEFDKALR
ncbi:MAG: aminotransferase class I/II-fold pyridoxal phosphate-dependent enzyme [Bacteroidota bacterium]|nr:aminotransferase class I/II-fold pyridoxal phosphate-dependent enzyme [Bacteroidota bacterium]MDP4269324.1 aminotransferase class I/II-fold pyridoxal phosphate-dependent enzyme [Bacteroidota bacterium]